MARPSNTDERRAQIVLGLQAVMAERGYEKATIAAIAEAAGLTPGLVHYHFGSKHEILISLVQRLAEGWRAQAEVVGVRRPRERLAALIDASLALGAGASPGAVACWVALGVEAVQQPEVRELYAAAVREATATLEQAVLKALRDEGRGTTRGRAIAAGLMAAIQGYLQLGLATPGLVPRGSAAATLQAMAFGAIDAQEERS
jgi:TetR/AcrR family transcriptional repressor of bet genes